NGVDENTASQLYGELSPYQEAMDACAGRLRPYLGLDIRSLLYPADREATEPLKPPAVVTSAAFAPEYALAQTWQAWGIMPESVPGVGSGEITAAVLAGVVSLADGARLAAAGELLALQAGQVQA